MTDRPRRGFARYIAFTAVLAAASTSFAHVELDVPNGGETLQAGSVTAIRWHETVNHGIADFDLWYSVDGGGGPWIEIVSDLVFQPGAGDMSYDWTVPNTPSNLVRVRVRQDNEDIDYEDVSDADLRIVASSTATEVTLTPVRDATLYEGDGSLANGSGSYLFTGATESQNGSLERRALIAFDIASVVPPGATITAARLDVTVSRTISAEQSVELRRVTEAWSEGPSDPSGQEGGGAAAQDGDATWVHRSYPSNSWSILGGSFASSTSAAQQVGGTGEVSFGSTAGMVADVQAWLDAPVDNHGWALVMPSPATGSAKRFNSRENSSPSTRPKLTVAYEGGSAPPSSTVVIPAAARAEGAAGSFFVTTADIHNPGSASATVFLEWLPRGADNGDPARSASFVLDPGQTRRFGDLLHDAFGLDDGVGAAAVVADVDGIEVMTRTFNTGVDGTFGQSLPGVAEDEMLGPDERALVLFLTENDAFRSNLGLVNGGAGTITVMWEIFDADGSSLAVRSTMIPARGNRQINQVLSDFAPIEAASVRVWTTTAGGLLTCYGSVLDNGSSDPTTVLPR